MINSKHRMAAKLLQVVLSSLSILSSKQFYLSIVFHNVFSLGTSNSKALFLSGWMDASMDGWMEGLID